jgi:hypothetical protein
VYTQLARAPPHYRSAPCRTVSHSFPDHKQETSKQTNQVLMRNPTISHAWKSTAICLWPIKQN